jgi:hypothetical protein
MTSTLNRYLVHVRLLPVEQLQGKVEAVRKQSPGQLVSRSCLLFLLRTYDPAVFQPDDPVAIGRIRF